MKPVYVRENLKITVFETEDVIMTSVIPDPLDPVKPQQFALERDNRFVKFTTFSKAPNSWFDE